MRLEGKVCVVVGAGQTPGATIGNGRATALTFAREGARLVLADRDLERARATERMVAEAGGEALSVEADVCSVDDCHRLVEVARETFGRIDVLHNNVGIGEGDATIGRISEETWLRIIDVNLNGMFRTCKAVLPVMREQRSGVIVNVSSIASICSVPLVAYKVSKAGVNALTQQLAVANASYGIRVNAILPGLIDTPMAVDGWARATGVPREEVSRIRDAQVPLGGRQGTAWDVANAALFLASDEAGFVTGVLLPVDGGQSVKVG